MMQLLDFYENEELLTKRVPFGLNGLGGDKKVLFRLALPDLLPGDVIDARAVCTFSNRTHNGGLMVPSLFVATRLALEPRAPLIADKETTGFWIGWTHALNMDNTGNVYGARHSFALYRNTEARSGWWLALRAWVSAERQTPSRFLVATGGSGCGIQCKIFR